MGLNQEQQAAVSYLEGPLLVLAGPGTGKTQLLSAKVAYILEHTDTNPENILCLTFTESGASNMRERLGSMIGKAAHDVNIYTYHAFGANILERYKSYAETFNRMLDAPIDEVAQYKIIRQIQEDLPVTDILKKAKISDLIETIQHAKSAQLTAADLAKIASVNQNESEKISQAANAAFTHLASRMKFHDALAEAYNPLALSLAPMCRAEPITKNIEHTANLLLRELNDLIEEQLHREKPSISPLTKWKTARFEKTTEGKIRLKDHIANKKLASLAQIMTKYDEYLQNEGLYDFADMIEEAIRALREDQGFRLSMSEIFQYILLDEFQDTNPSQFEIIKLLTEYESPIVMAVGDDDQAIFEFQGASASNLLDFQNHYQAKVITLLDNYRSSGEILDFSHRVAEQINDSFAKHHGVAKKLRSMKDLQQKSQAQLTSNIERHEFLSAHDEYYWIAEKISDLISSGVSPDEIAVIAPKHKYVAPLLPYLKAHDNIDIAYEKRSNLLEDPKIHELIVLARFISELAHEAQPSHQLLEILSFPFFGIKPITALRAIGQAHILKKPTLDYLADSDDEKLAWIANWLAQLTSLSFETPLELWLQYLTGIAEIPEVNMTSPFLSYYQEHASQVELFELYENLNTLKNTAIKHTQNQKPKLDDFITMLNDYEEAGAAIVATSPYRDSSKSVQIVSAHKSKGLEFEYVFMIAVDDRAWGKAKGNNNLFSLPRNLVQIRHTGITDDEQLRLLFVAITRAKKYLIMTNSVEDFSEKSAARLQYLNEQRDPKEPAQVSPYLPAGAEQITLHNDEFSTATKMEALQRSWIGAYQELTPDLRLMLESELENYRLTASDLTSFIDIIYAGPTIFYQRKVIHAPEEPLTPELAYGTIMHAALEQIVNQGATDEAALKFFQEKAAEQPLSHHQIEELQEKGAHSLGITLKTFQDLIHSEQVKAEVNLSSEHLSYSGVPVTGKIDLISVNPETKEIEVYDYKTSKYRDSKWDKHPSLYKYALQLEFYKLLLSLSPSYRNYKVTCGHILFVSPDDEGKVYDKIYDFEPDITKDFQKLIPAVYHQVKTLDFLERPELNLTPDKARTIEHIKQFVELLTESIDI